MSVFSSEDETENLHYTSPITRNGFTFYGPDKFFVQDDQHRHPRKDAESLYSILTYTPPPPVLTKKGTIAKRQPPPFKEPPAHFFTAQMAHYGLKPLKTKEPAKKKLLAAFASAGGNGKTLIVPNAILELENALKKEWHDADEARKAKLEASRASYEENIIVGGPGVERVGLYEGYGLYHDSDELMEEKESDKNASGSDADKELTKKDIQNEIENLPIARARGLLLKLLQEDTRAKGIMEKEIMWSRNTVKQGYKETGQPLERGDWEGKFILKCPAIKQGWGGYEYHEFSLTIYPSSTSPRLWISFDLGVISGVMRSVRGLPKVVGEKVLAEWRGCEDGEGVMTFGDGNSAVLTFFGDGNVEGELRGDFCAGKAPFTGSKNKSFKIPGNVKSHVRKFKAEFRSYNWHNYEVANKQRWGKWGGEERAESAYESDTSAGDHNRKRALAMESGGESSDREDYDYESLNVAF